MWGEDVSLILGGREWEMLEGLNIPSGRLARFMVIFERGARELFWSRVKCASTDTLEDDDRRWAGMAGGSEG